MKPYYAVIFTSTLSEMTEGYDEMTIHIEQMAKIQSGFLGMETARSEIGVTVSYWKESGIYKIVEVQFRSSQCSKNGERKMVSVIPG